MISSHFFNSGLLLPLFIMSLSALCVTIFWIYKRDAIIKKLAHKQNRTLLVQGYSFNRDVLHTILRIIAFIAICIALLDPKGASHEIETTQKSKDVMFLVDISRSMLAEDVLPSRLEAVKKFISSFVQNTHDFAYGLTVFSTNALTLCPMTYEKSTFLMFLSDLSQKTVTAGGTSLKSVLEHVAIMYEQNGMQGYHTCVLFTDGEDFSGDLSDIANRLSSQNVTMFVVGVGSEVGAPIPFYNATGIRQGHVKDSQGSVVISRRNDAVLANLATSLHGKYITFDQNDVSNMQHWLNETAKTQENKTKTSQYDSYAYRASFIAWLLLIIDWLLP